jgi:putrescine transport system permease protein
MTGGLGRRLVIAGPLLWLCLFFLLPSLMVAGIAISTPSQGVPPYVPALRWDPATGLEFTPNFANLALLFRDDLYIAAYLNSLLTAGIAALGCLLIGYPIAYGVAQAKPERRVVLLMLIILPFWTSFLVRVYAWIGLLQNNGLINSALLALGVIEEPLALIATPFAVQIGLIYTYLPFMILPLYANLEKHDPSLLEAAADLGCRPWRAFLGVTLPLSLPGIIAGSLLVFVPAVGEFVIPELLGGTDTLMIGSVLWSEFFSNRDWPVASSVAVALLILLVGPILLLQRSLAQRSEARR